jgi:GTP-binding protein Era
VNEPFRAALVGVAGRPNVGKSTLVNALCGAHVSIVSDKPQTTRRRVAGVLNGDDWQIVLLDLPGFQTPRDGLTGRMQRTVDETLADVDAILFVLDGTEPPGAGDRFIAARVFASGTPVVLAVNKIDRLSPAAIGAAIERIAGLGDFAALVPVSARTSDGIDRVRDELLARAVEGPALYPVDATSGDPVRLRIAELVREAALNRTREEVPHAVAVLVDELVPATRRAAARVTCDVLCDTESQKGILIGKGGEMVKRIGTLARKELQELLGCKVHLELFVKVEPDWTKTAAGLRRVGYGGS